MKERGIIFTGESVRAILAGRKTQTRRVVKPNRNDGTFILMETMDGGWWPYRSRDGESCYPYGCEVPYSAPYGGEGARLYVKETWRRPMDPDGETLTGVEYRADASQLARDIGIGWKSSMFMPRWASRITLEVVDVRVERLQETTEADAIAEGCEGHPVDGHSGYPIGGSPVDEFRQGWDYINGKRAPWASNPHVWVILFRRLQ